MKRLIRVSDKNTDNIIKYITNFLDTGVHSRNAIDELISRAISNFPDSVSSGTFYRGHLIDTDKKSFLNKLSLLKGYIDKIETLTDVETDENVINQEKEKYKNMNIPNDVIDEIKKVCVDTVKSDSSYYSFSKSYDAARNYILKGVYDMFDGDIFFVFKSSTSGLDIEKLHDNVMSLDDIDENIKNSFDRTYRGCKNEQEILCQINEVDIFTFQDLDLNSASMSELLSKFGINI